MSVTLDAPLIGFLLWRRTKAVLPQRDRDGRGRSEQSSGRRSSGERVRARCRRAVEWHRGWSASRASALRASLRDPW